MAIRVQTPKGDGEMDARGGISGPLPLEFVRDILIVQHLYELLLHVQTTI
jgi:hypothetical protein